MAKVRKIYDMCAITGKYTNKNNEEKNEYTNIGKFFIMDDNSFFSVIKTVPVGAWDGKVSYFEQKEKEQAAPPQTTTAPPAASYQAPAQDGDTLPF